ncbi:MAG: hypothetical protein KGJ07_02335 [Patescibacteria group bacterium]|nr:hypothetical protein [Patescibacteria group bacterium]MDE2589534.1 hypothetical protein [Patescibacteria group bacterium]
MEITKLSESGLKIKSKTALFGVHPMGLKSRLACDAALLLQHTYTSDALSVEGETVIINGPGEYEIKGIKLAGVGKGEDLGYLGRIEGVSVFVVKASSLVKSKDLMQDCQVLLIQADVLVEENLIASSGAQVAVLFGAHAEESAKQLGKEVAPVSKYTTTKDKLPSETEIVVLS